MRFLGDGAWAPEGTGEGKKKDTDRQTASLILRERRSSHGSPAASRSAALQASINFSATSARISPRPTSSSASSKGPTTRCSSQAQGFASPLTKRFASSKAFSETSSHLAASKSRQSGLSEGSGLRQAMAQHKSTPPGGDGGVAWRASSISSTNSEGSFSQALHKARAPSLSSGKPYASPSTAIMASSVSTSSFLASIPSRISSASEVVALLDL